MLIYKYLFRRIHEPPESLPSSHYRSWVLINYACIMGWIVHFLFIFLFSLVGVNPLALINIASSVMWAFAIYYNINGSMRASLTFANTEVVMHAWLCTIIIGWNTGFHYHILVMPAVLFLTPLKVTTKIIISAINLILYSLLSFYLQYFIPLIPLNTTIVYIFNYTNIVVFGFILAYFSFHYRNVVIETEAELKLEHQKTNTALIERNQTVKQLNRELAEAADYVKSLLPNPILEGEIKTEWIFIPSQSLGGDAFGYHWIDNDHFAIYLLDVSGHGVGAALLSVSVMKSLRSQSLPDTDFKDCRQVLESLNATFPSEDNNDMFFTIWYGVYKNSTRELSYASGGHPPALLLENCNKLDTDAILLRTPNYVIGGIPGVSYGTRKHLVNRHTKLYVFSDGVYEVTKADGSMWCLKEFANYMSVVKTDDQSILDQLHRYATNLKQSTNFEDDFTIIEVAFT
ncbi:MAG: PP2C family protein-serine/threonine phosphatase [Nitrospinales bacterium]